MILYYFKWLDNIPKVHIFISRIFFNIFCIFRFILFYFIKNIFLVFLNFQVFFLILFKKLVFFNFCAFLILFFFVFDQV